MLINFIGIPTSGIRSSSSGFFSRSETDESPLGVDMLYAYFRTMLISALVSAFLCMSRRAVSPYAEQAAKIFWQGRSKKSRFTFLPTRLTQTRRSLAKSGNLIRNDATVPKTNPRCPLCGAKCHNRLAVLREMRSRREPRKSSQSGDASHRYSQRNCRSSEV